MEKALLFKFFTPYHDLYAVSVDGDIVKSEYGKKEHEFSEQWKFQGLLSVKSNTFIPFKNIKLQMESGLVLCYKNRNPKFTVVDLDHGTTRVWGNSTVHGVAGLTFDSL